MSSIVLYPLRLWYLTLSQNVDGVGVRGRVDNPDGREGGHENHSVVLRLSIDDTITSPSIFFNTIIRSLVGSYDSNLLIALYLLKHLCLDSNLNSSWREDSELLVVRLLF